MTGQPRDSSMTDVLIVGAGPTGLTMAAELTRHGVRCRIIDKAPAPAAESRAIGIVSRTLEVFEAMGVAEVILRASLRLRAASVSAGNHRILHLTFEGLDSPYPFAAVLPQSDTERLLAAHLADMGVMVEREVELIGSAQQAEAVTAHLRHRDGGEEICRAQWLIGCDGAHSTVRRTLGVSFTGVRYEEAFLLADVRMRSDLPHDESWSFYHRAGQLLFFPLPNDAWRVVAILEGGNDPRATAEATLADMQALVDERGPGGITLTEAFWISSFRVSRRMVQQFRSGRVFLAGDAAHIHSPAGGQGMNTSIQDAYNLA